ncbi:MAG: hypothetical protein GY722_24715 [bacterium]|nr:hypothetical protein [bacterium]
MRTEDNENGASRFLKGIQRYFGFGRPGLAPRQRWRIFLANEQRSWDRLLGRSSGPSSCDGAGPDPPSSAFS